MTTPALLTGSVVSPSRVVDPQTHAAAKLGEVLKDIVSRSGVYHSEGQVLSAHEAVDDFVKAFSSGTAELLEHFRAAIAAPASGPVSAPAPAASAAPVIDYNALARAIVSAQSGGAS